MNGEMTCFKSIPDEKHIMALLVQETGFTNVKIEYTTSVSGWY